MSFSVAVEVVRSCMGFKSTIIAIERLPTKLLLKTMSHLNNYLLRIRLPSYPQVRYMLLKHRVVATEGLLACLNAGKKRRREKENIKRSQAHTSTSSHWRTWALHPRVVLRKR